MEIDCHQRKKNCPRITPMNANKNGCRIIPRLFLLKKKIFAAIRVIRGQKILFLAVSNNRAAQ
jgi:hypothetical protein